MKKELLKDVKFKIALGVACLFLLPTLFLLSPIFYINEVEISGISIINDGDIMNRLGLESTSNILLFNINAARRRIEGNLYVDAVSIRRGMPNKLYVTILERRLSAYVSHIPGSYMLLDDNGRVIEIRAFRSEPLPILQGLQFTYSQLGDILNVYNDTDFLSVVQYTQLLVAYDIINEITYINVSDPQNIRILVNYLEFNVGNNTNADDKVRTIVEVLQQLPDAGRLRGFVDLREIRPEFILTFLQ